MELLQTRTPKNMNHYINIKFDESYQDNKPGNFYCLLDEPLELSGNYEVALVDMCYPVDYNVNFGTIEGSVSQDLYKYSDDIDDFFEENNKFEFSDFIEVLNNYFETAYHDYEVSRSFIQINLHPISVNDGNDWQKIADWQIQMNYHFKNYFESINKLITTFELSNKNLILEEKFNKLKSDKQAILHQINSREWSNAKNLKELNLMCQEFSQKLLNFDFNYKPNFDEMKQNLIFTDRMTDVQIKSLFLKKFPGHLFTTVHPTKLKFNNLNQISILNQKKFINISSFKNKIKNFFIFTDIICESNIFNNFQPILKIIKPEGSWGEYINKSFLNPHYFKINKTYINKINIIIKDENNLIIDFNTGPVVLNLHFRPSKK